MSAKNRWTMCGVLPALLVLASMAEVEAASFRILGRSWFGAFEWSHTTVSGVSADGTIAVGSYSHYPEGGWPYAYPRRWSADGEPLPAGNFEGVARGVSADGSVVIGQMGGELVLLRDPGMGPQSGETFRWTPGGGVVGLGYLTEGGTYSSAFGVSADGSTVVGQSGSDSGRPAFRWTQSEGMVGLGTLPDHYESRAEGVSADGSVIVGSSRSSSADEAFRWTADGEMVGLGRLGNHLDSSAGDVSADGAVVVGYSGNRFLWQRYSPDREPADEDYEAFVWTEADGMVGLGYLPGHGWSWANAVSADGSIVVGASGPPVRGNGPILSSRSGEAFIWDAEHGMRSLRDLLINEYQLELPDWSLGSPTGISADGNVIVGNGDYGAWMVVIPEPSTIVLTLTGLVGLLAYTWRKRRHAA